MAELRVELESLAPSLRRDRLKKALSLTQRLRTEAILIVNQANIFYLTGLRASLAFLVLCEDKAYLFTDGRYYERAKDLVSDLLKVNLIMENPLGTLKSFLRSLKVKAISFEVEHVSIAMRNALRSRHYRLYPVKGILSNLRQQKDRLEIELIKGAVKLTDRIFEELIKEPLIGETELMLRAKIISKAFENSAKGESFPSIVAFGEASAIPHWESSDRRIEGSGPLLLDFGVVYQGYVSDFTRTIHLGKASSDFKKFYGYVKEAYERALEAVKVGRDLREIDRLVRDYFRQKGVLSAFVHSTGHGLGIEIHEPPRLYYRLKEEAKIEEGMVFTIEPGLYFPGKFGIRLENVVFVEDRRGMVYSEVPLELLVI